MNKLILTTDDVFVKNGQRMKIVTSGIDLDERFNENPIMLYEHNPEKHLGIWSQIEVSEHNIKATADFDDDELSLNIQKKLIKGSIKSASIGIKPTDAYMSGDVLIINKSVLLEASIVGVPANKRAKKVDFSLTSDIILLSSGSEELNLEEYLNKIKNMKKETKVEKVEEVKKTDLELSNELNLSLNTKVEDLTATKIELSLELDKLNLAATENTKVINDLRKELETNKTENTSIVNKLNTEIEVMKTEKMENLLNLSVEQGKISNEAKADFLDLSFEKAESILSKLNTADLSLSATLKNSSKTEHRDYDWYLKNDKEGLRKIAKENPALYSQIEKTQNKNK